MMSIKQKNAVFRLTEKSYGHEIQCKLSENCKHGQFRLSAKDLRNIFRTHSHSEKLPWMVSYSKTLRETF